MSKRIKWPDTIKRRIAALQNYKCAMCQKPLPAAWETDHKVALHKGGKDEIENLQILDPSCHATKTYNERHLDRLQQEIERNKRIEQLTPKPRPCTPPPEHIDDFISYLDRFECGEAQRRAAIARDTEVDFSDDMPPIYPIIVHRIKAITLTHTKMKEEKECR
jgi:hypothetical protein